MKIAPERWQDLQVKARGEVVLRDMPTASDKHISSKRHARKVLKQYRREIDSLLRVLAEENRRSVLLILQGMDASGKDSTVRRVFTGVNPQNCRVVSFKEPTEEDLDRNYLWRIAKAAPRRGELRIFNRSQYEDALLPTVLGSHPTREMEVRLRQIADLERYWAENDGTIRKCFLHISRSEQLERFRSRLKNPEKQWKVKETDFRDARHWSKFQGAYATALSATSTAEAPWFVIPADRKWYRDVAVAGIVLAALRAMKPKTPKPTLDLKKFKL